MLTETEEVIPRFAFREGELHIQAGNMAMTLRGFPSPRALFSKCDQEWKEFQPGFRLVKPSVDSTESPSTAPSLAPEDDAQETISDKEINDEKQRAFQDFRASLAPETATAVERFQSHQWNLIDLLSHAEPARDLSASNPVLAWCLANNDQFKRAWAHPPAAYAKPIIDRKQREILEWLGFPGTKSVVNMLRRIPPEAITPLDARSLRRALLAEPEVPRHLAHLRTINSGVLGLTCNMKLLSVISPHLLLEVAEAPEERINQHTADLLIHAMYLMMRGSIPWTVPRFHAIWTVQEFHERVVAEWLRREEAASRPTPQKPQKKIIVPADQFPPPPIPGTNSIIPLTTKEDLKSEGEKQRNCVGSYAGRVRDGSIYLYKVLKPERSTLEIVRGPGGFWRRSQIEAAENKTVTSQTKAAVDHWLSRFSLSV